MRKTPLLLLAAIAFSLFNPSSHQLRGADRTADWNAVTAAQKAGQPKTASTTLDKIIGGAIADAAWPEAVRAILEKARTDASTEEYRLRSAAVIRALNEWLAPDRTPALAPQIRSLLETALAKSWWSYYQDNRWQLLQRTRTDAKPSEDFLTWDAIRVLAEAGRHFEAALADRVALQRTPVSALEPLLAPGRLSDAYRPTLYDFLAHEAIAFYSAGEQGVPKPENAFAPTVESPLLGTLEEFLAWQPAATGSAGVSPALRAVELYQDILRFHQNDSDKRALFDADLSRINWAASFLGESVRERHIAALRAIILRAAKQTPEISAEASRRLALLLEDGDPAAARDVALAAVALAPKSVENAVNSCRNIVARIEAPALQGITTENAWASPLPDIAVRYRNQNKIWFRAYSIDPDNLSKAGYLNSLYEKGLKKLRSRPLQKTWSAALPSTKDFRFREEKLPAPADLPPGFYVIAASFDQQFSEKENLIATAEVCVTNLAIVHDGVSYTEGRVRGFVVNATTGEPVVGASVRGWYDDWNSSARQVTAISGIDGSFTLSSTQKRTNLRLLRATAHDGKTACVMSYQRRESEPRDFNYDERYIYFFTDRAIYRPGQTVQFKAVVISANAATTEYKPLASGAVTVVIDDPNGKEAGKLELVTNEFGSVSGSFVIPAGRLAGQYRLHTPSDEKGSAFISIEEYKRPKFEVTLPAPETAPKLKAEVTLTGIATAYTGAPVDGAKVTWRVQRLVRWPRWCWWYSVRPGAAAEIAHGNATTDGAGKFSLQFVARPDASADIKAEPIFNYTITTEVTDTTGETRTATRTILVGYTALVADITAGRDWQTADAPVALTLGTRTLDGTAQVAQGTVAIHALKQPVAVIRPQLDVAYRRYAYERAFAKASNSGKPATTTDSADPRDWPVQDTPIATIPFVTSKEKGTAEITTQLPAGIYRAIVTTQDRFGKPVTAQTEIRVLAPDAKTHPIKETLSLAAPAWTAQPGDTVAALWSTGYATARARVSIEQNGKTLRSFWTEPGATQQRIPVEITESMRGGITLRVFQVRDNRIVTETRRIDVPWDNKNLKITWGSFNSKLTPGGRETWTARITGPDAAHAAAEFTAALYDASLDQYRPHSWPARIAPFRNERGYYTAWAMSNDLEAFRKNVDGIRPKYFALKQGAAYRHWAGETLHFVGDDRDDVVTLDKFVVSGGGYITARAASVRKSAPASAAAKPAKVAASTRHAEFEQNVDSLAMPARPTPEMTALSGEDSKDAPAPDLSAVAARKNLNETAFFFPQLYTDSDGSVRMEFTVPEALTRWKFLGFAHDKQLRSAVLTDTAVTAKDLMVQPNPPRFLREGDTVDFTVKITNMTDQPLQGTAQLSFADASSLESVDLFADEGAAEKFQIPNSKLQKNSKSQNPKSQTQSFTLAPNSSQTLSWRITIPDGQGFLTYKAVASTGTVSDGEEGFLPVLSRRQLVTESIALPIRDKGTRTFRFDKLAELGNAGKMPALPVSESLTIQMTSNPAWYAVLALPSLMEFPHECSEQLFNRYYANALAAHIANSDPKIARVFEQWRNTPATESPLLKNDELKSVLIEETPWLRAATGESEQRRALAQHLDVNRANAQASAIIETLAKRQRRDGLWSWFPGGDGSEYITRYLVAGFARLRHFGITLAPQADAMLKRAVGALDDALAERYARLRKQKNFNPDDNHLGSADVYQLYVRSFFLSENPIPANARAACDFFGEQARKHWLSLPRLSQGHVALACARSGDAKTAAAVVESLRQRAKNSDELGMWWTDTERGWFWWQAPVETQALMIEVFDEVARDAQAVADLQLWLLKQKQTQAWPSTKATADAVYALLLRGADKLASDALVSVSLGDKKIAPEKTEAGTGFYTERIPGALVTSAMGEKITVTKTDAGPAWGSVTWQYFQSVDKITPHEGTPLTLKKTIWKQINTASGPTLVALDKTKLEPGDTLVVRIELRADRDMEFVHMKDQRGSGTEPVNVLSGYRWKNGLGYYESTRDTATHFFIDRLNAATYVFEYPIRVQLRGKYESGIAEIQCMYAPEFNSHSASTTLVVE